MALRNFFRENFALIIGLSLPVLMVLGFLLATHLPQKGDDPPQYELVFSVTRYDNQSPYHVEFSVRDQKLYMRLTPKKEQGGVYVMDLFIYNGQKESIRKISYLPPSEQSIEFEKEILVDALSNVTIDNNSKAPDGYEFEPGSYRSRGLLGEIFGGRSGRYINRVRKTNGGNYVIPDYGNGYSYGGLSFIGWIVYSDNP